MKKVKLLFCLAVFTALAAGCQGKDKSPYDAGQLEKDFQKYVKADTSCCAESMMTLKYKQMSENEVALVQAFLGGSELESVDEQYPQFGVSIRVPDAEGVAEIIASDDGLAVDYQSLLVGGGGEDEVKKLVDEYVCSLLEYSEFPLKEEHFSVSVDGDQKWESDAELFALVNGFVSYDFVGALGKSKDDSKSEGSSATECDGEFAEVGLNGSFICSFDGVKFLVDDIVVTEGEEALEAVRGLSASNAQASVAMEDKCLYVTYKMTNLSQVKGVAEDCFVLAEDGVILTNSGMKISGLRNTAKVKPGKQVTMNTFLVGSSNSSLFWYSEGVIGSYSIVVP